MQSSCTTGVLPCVQHQCALQWLATAADVSLTAHFTPCLDGGALFVQENIMMYTLMHWAR